MIRTTQLLSRYLGDALTALSGYLAITDDHAYMIVSAVIYMISRGIDHWMHRKQN